MTDFIFNIILIINNLIDIYYFYSFILYFFITLIFFSFSLPGGLLVCLASGFFFGFIPGYIINVFSASLGSLISIFLFKTILKRLFNKYYLKYSEKFTGYLKNSSYEYLILFRLIFGIPLVVQNIGISMLKVSNTTIFISSFIGFSPIMLIFSYSGIYVSDIIYLNELTLSKIFSLEIILILLILITLMIFKIYYKK